MDETLKDLADLLVESVPTIIFFLFLVWYLRRVYFRPIAKILEERRQSTAGVRDLAQRALEAADQKQSEFERALQLARAQIHEDNEKLRRQWAHEQTETIAKARADLDAQIENAKQDLAHESDVVKSQLDSEVERLSDSIVNSLLGRRAA